MMTIEGTCTIMIPLVLGRDFMTCHTRDDNGIIGVNDQIRQEQVHVQDMGASGI